MTEDQPDATADEVALLAIASGASPIEAIKQLRDQFGLPLGEAKQIVHRNLSIDRQVAAEALWDQAEAEVREWLGD